MIYEFMEIGWFNVVTFSSNVIDTSLFVFQISESDHFGIYAISFSSISLFVYFPFSISDHLGDISIYGNRRVQVIRASDCSCFLFIFYVSILCFVKNLLWLTLLNLILSSLPWVYYYHFIFTTRLLSADVSP